jgi:hypothetical protein
MKSIRFEVREHSYAHNGESELIATDGHRFQAIRITSKDSKTEVANQLRQIASNIERDELMCQADIPDIAKVLILPHEFGS